MTTRTKTPTDPLLRQLHNRVVILEHAIRAYRHEQQWFRYGTANAHDIRQARGHVRWAVQQVREQRAYLASIGRKAA